MTFYRRSFKDQEMKYTKIRSDTIRVELATSFVDIQLTENGNGLEVRSLRGILNVIPRCSNLIEIRGAFM